MRTVYLKSEIDDCTLPDDSSIPGSVLYPKSFALFFSFRICDLSYKDNFEDLMLSMLSNLEVIESSVQRRPRDLIKY